MQQVRRERRDCRPAAALLALGLALSGVARAHEVAGDGLPAQPGGQVEAAIALSAVHARQAWPTPRWSGVLGSGVQADDRRGGQVEHAALGAAVRVDPAPAWSLGARLAYGWHGEGRPHVEAATAELRHRLDADQLGLTVGRLALPMGEALTGAGHLDRYAQTPLIRRAISDGDWIDDGALLRWRVGDGQADGVQGVEVGVWRARVLPGAADAGMAPSVHLQAGRDDWQVDGFAMRLTPRGRGTYAAGTGAGHTHDQPDCQRSLVGVACFGGRSWVLGASVRWAPHDLPVALTLAGLTLDERGTLDSLGGSADYRGRTTGGWLDAVWSLAPHWQLGARAERLVARHRLTGPGASAVARDAGLTPNEPQRRLAGSLAWQPVDAVRLIAEAGVEQGSGPTLRWVGLRLVAQSTWLQ